MFGGKVRKQWKGPPDAVVFLDYRHKHDDWRLHLGMHNNRPPRGVV